MTWEYSVVTLLSVPSSKPPFPIHHFDPNVPKYLSMRSNKLFYCLLLYKVILLLCSRQRQWREIHHMPQTKTWSQPLPNPPISSTLSLTVFLPCHPDSPLSAVVFAFTLENWLTAQSLNSNVKRMRIGLSRSKTKAFLNIHQGKVTDGLCCMAGIGERGGVEFLSVVYRKTFITF